jgi:predicted dithiol-disulfide oxidoreductase (DUF899 family)
MRVTPRSISDDWSVREEWIGARGQHLAREKELTRLRDQLSRERRDEPTQSVSINQFKEGIT